MAKQEIWIKIQDDLSRAHSVLQSLIDVEGRIIEDKKDTEEEKYQEHRGEVCGIDIDSCRLLFHRISEIKDNKSLQIEFDDIPETEKPGRAKKMLDVLMQYDLCGGKVEEYDPDKELNRMFEYSEKVGLLNDEKQEWIRVFSRLIYDVETFIIGYCPQEYNNTKKVKKANFRDCIQYEDKEELIKRLHELIDGKQGRDVGYVLLKCRIDSLITRNPTKAEMNVEFPSVNYNSSVKNYLTEESLSDNGKVSKASQIVIFDY